MGTFFALQSAVSNAALLSILATLFGAATVFLLLYLVLERKKKTLAVVSVLAVAAIGGGYWYTAHGVNASILDAPKQIVTERVLADKPLIQAPSPVPLPKPRPRVKKKICPPSPRRPLPLPPQ